MTLPPESQWPVWMQKAVADVGVRELPGVAVHPRIAQYLAATRLPEDKQTDDRSWCAAFVCFVLESSGMLNPRYAMARNFLNYGEPVESPQFGDILVFSRGPDPNKGHVGFMVQNERSDYLILSGNDRNSVRFGHRPKSELLGARRPVGR